jgi:predicted ArsR family transcriptional regulator
MLEIGDDNTGVVDEDQAGDGGDETALDIEVLTVVNNLHGKEVLDALLVKVLVDLEDAVALVVGYSHGIPEGLAHLLLKLFRQEGVTATWDGRGQEGTGIVCTHHRSTVVQQHT